MQIFDGPTREKVALNSLPHGPEFRFVDEILELQPGRAATGTYRLPQDAQFLRGHLPGDPILPGVLMIEGMVQLAAIVAQCDPEHATLNNIRLTAVRGAKILGTIPPGETLELSIEIAVRLGNLVQAKGAVLHQGQKLAETQVTLSGD